MVLTGGYERLWVVRSFHGWLQVVVGGFRMVTDGHGVEMGGQGWLQWLELVFSGIKFF